MVASVAMMPMTGDFFDPAAATAARAPGSITPLIGTFGNAARIAGSATAVAGLHATTTCLGLRGSRYVMIWWTKLVTVAALFDPYGRRAVSPKYSRSSYGKAARSARATVSPPSPLSSTTIGDV